MQMLCLTGLILNSQTFSSFAYLVHLYAIQNGNYKLLLKYIYKYIHFLAFYFSIFLPSNVCSHTKSHFFHVNLFFLHLVDPSTILLLCRIFIPTTLLSGYLLEPRLWCETTSRDVFWYTK